MEIQVDVSILFMHSACVTYKRRYMVYNNYSLFFTATAAYVTVSGDAKCKFWVRPKITARSVRGRYLVYFVVVIYVVLAALCRSTKCQLGIVSPGVI